MAEAVNHPAHYNAHPSGVEAIDIVEHLFRRDHKGRSLEDTTKALWYLERELERLHHTRTVEAPPPAAFRSMEHVIKADPHSVLALVLRKFARMRGGDIHVESMIDLVEFMVATVNESLQFRTTSEGGPQ